VSADELGKPVVFCVDDDPHLLAWLDLILEDAGYDVKTEAGGRKAVERIRESHPDVILLDINMPEIDGYEVCRLLQAQPETAYVPVIFVTGRKAEQDRVRAFQMGAVDYLMKPLQKETLLESVGAQLVNRRKWCEMRQVSSMRKPPASHSPDLLAPTGTDRWSAKYDSGQYSLFKSFLSVKVKVPQDRQRFLSGLLAGALYSGSATLGISGEKVAQAMAEFLRVPYLPELNLEEVTLGVFPPSFSMKNHILAVGPASEAAFIVSNPFNWEFSEILGRVCGEGKVPKLTLTEPASFEAMTAGPKRAPAAKPSSLPDIQAQLLREYSVLAPASDLSDREAATSGPLIDLVNRLIEDAYVVGSSDIHLEPSGLEVVVRYRIDGELRVINRLQPAELIRRIIARLKVMSSIDLAEHRLPQDGRIQFKDFCGGRHDFDLRVAIIPVSFGEKASLRIIDKQKAVMPLENLGFSERNLKVYREKIRAPHGMILHVGPTGSGKSMSLYAALNEIMSPAMNIQTAEDPIEYTLAGINQTQVNSDIGLTFARALRSFLRADPDIILVGEIRDLETAKTAIEASLTGHMLFSTLHTNDAASTVQRFIEMGIESYLISSTLLMVCAQRLLRRLCPHCKEPYVPGNDERNMAGILEEKAPRLYRAKGCELCGHQGYRGRIAVHEILVPNDLFRHAINRPGVSSEELKRIAVETCGMTTLFQDAMEKVRTGMCSVEDALANVAVEDIERGRGHKPDTLPAIAVITKEAV
jgi:type IV pilus assembly protein PilB